MALLRLNPGLAAAKADEVLDKLTGDGAQSLVAGNKEVYDWLRNGVPVQRVEADGTRAVLRAQVIEKLIKLAQELTDKLRKSATINWQNRKSSRARMMAMIKVLLAKHKYPPDKQPEAIEKVITQAELLADLWAGERD